MIHKICFLTMLLVTNFFSFSQSHHKVLADKNTKEPIQFATIKVLKKPYGAITTERGTFFLSISNTDSIYISSLGYCDTILLFSNTSDTILLTPKFNQLVNVTISSQKIGNKILLGNGTTFKNKKNLCKQNKNTSECYYWVSGGGAEFAELIKLPNYDKNYIINSVSLPLKKINCWESFIIKLYTVNDKELKPDSLFFQKVVTLTDITKNKNGKIKISLKEDNIVLRNKNSIAISFSWIEPSENNFCGTGLFLRKGITGVCFSRSIFSPEHNWAVFNGNKKAEDQSKGLYRTMFLIELSERK
ncbi:MAG: carboxypeptidase-like regulatory domain-containing protein [Chitinophagaceae bacterium]|nr:carboxypeptidase-like regulatory domain-containing protein [Chitinophagaceae bacterium]